MAEYTTIGTIEVVTDTDSPAWKMGELNVSMKSETLRDYIRSYGTGMLLEGIAHLQYKIIEAMREVNREIDRDSVKGGINESSYDDIPKKGGTE